jgi:hypothetical protein
MGAHGVPIQNSSHSYVNIFILDIYLIVCIHTSTPLKFKKVEAQQLSIAYTLAMM